MIIVDLFPPTSPPSLPSKYGLIRCISNAWRPTQAEKSSSNIAPTCAVQQRHLPTSARHPPILLTPTP